MEKIPFIVGNWKMNKTGKEAVLFIENLKDQITNCKASVGIAIPFTFIKEAFKASENTKIIIGAQNMHFADKGAFTGEVSARMLEDIGAEFVILGHSERRALFSETDDLINKKLLKALEEDISPILCIGESEEEREKGKMEEVLKRQLEEGLKNVSEEDAKDIVIAYEPVWAIGTGKSATSEIAENAHVFIRKCLKEIFSFNISDKMYVLYGGSVKEENVEELLSKKNIDGALIGGASLNIESFSKIIKKF